MTPLEEAVEVVAFKDAQAFRQSVFDHVARLQRPVRWARALHRALPFDWARAAFVSLYGVQAYLAVAPPRSGSAPWGLARYRNEGRQLAWLERATGVSIARVGLGPKALLGLGGLAALGRELARPGRVVRGLDLVRRHERGDFLVSARVASTVGYYARLLRELPEGCRAVVVSSDSNPYAMAAWGAARRRGIPIVYITHGHIPEGPPALRFDLSLLDGPAVLAVYERGGGVEGEVAFKGAEGTRGDMQTAPLRETRPFRVGVFLSLVVDWGGVNALLDALAADPRVGSVLLRLHPNEQVRDAPAGLAARPKLEVSGGETILTDDARRCDLVIAGESSCHLTLLKLGVPTVHLPGLDRVPADFYRFLAERVVCGASELAEVSFPAVADFYDDPDWARRFARFDASYLEGPRDAAVASALARALGEPRR